MTTLSSRILEVVSYGNKDCNVSRNWTKSMKKYGFPATITGIGTKWEGFRSKTKGMHDYVVNHPNPPKYMIICDCFDIMAYNESQDIIGTFLDFEAELVFGAERVCITSVNCAKIPRFVNDTKYGNYPYLNSGFCMGTYEAIKHLLEWNMQCGIDDDQLACCNYVIKHPEKKIELDCEWKLVANIIPFEIQRAKQLQPYFVHFPGSKVDMNMRYNTMGKIILGREFEEAEMVTNHSVWVILFFVILLMLFVAFNAYFFWVLVFFLLFSIIYYVYSNT